MDKLTQIEAFVTAMDTGSLARAALVAEVTPVMIGRRIDALDSGSASACFIARPAVWHSPRGPRYLELCRRLLADLEHADTLISERRDTAAGHSLVGVGARRLRPPARGAPRACVRGPLTPACAYRSG